MIGESFKVFIFYRLFLILFLIIYVYNDLEIFFIEKFIFLYGLGMYVVVNKIKFN